MDKKNYTGIRIVISIVLITIIIITVLYLYNNKDSLLSQKTVVKYSDGCTETYINDTLVGDECILGRMQIGRAHV